MNRRITLYTVADKTPPLRTDLILWFTDDNGLICDWKEVKLKVEVPRSQEEWDSIPSDEHKFFVWDDGMPLYEDDMWSYQYLDQPKRKELIAEKVAKRKAEAEKLYETAYIWRRVDQNAPRYCPECSCITSTMYDSEPGIEGWVIGCNTPHCTGNINFAYGFLNLCDAQSAFDANQGLCVVNGYA